MVKNIPKNGFSIMRHTFNECPKLNNVKILHKTVNMPPNLHLILC